jgi:hypothetical protein
MSMVNNNDYAKDYVEGVAANLTIRQQQLKLENDLLWKFIAQISDADDTYDGMMANALIKRFKKDKSKLRKSRMRLPNIKREM